MEAATISAIIGPVLAFAGGAMALVIGEGRSNRKAIQELTDALWDYIDAVTEERGQSDRLPPTRYRKGKRRV